MTERRVAWAITGAGHALEECVDVLLKIEMLDIFLSRAGEEVLRQLHYIQANVAGGVLNDVPKSFWDQYYYQYYKYGYKYV